MNLRDLRYLVALSNERHFGRAADACHVSQPTLSAQIRKLEAYLGVQLIERTTRGALLTGIGTAVTARARDVLRGADDIVQLARAHQDPLAGPIRFGLIPTLAPYLLPHVIGALREACPRLELLLFEEQTLRLLERLHAGELDCAALALPVDLKGLESQTLFHEPFVVAMPSGHRLARRRWLRATDLEDERMLLLEEGHCLRDQALEVCSSVRVEHAGEFRATSLETLRHMVAAGAGVTLLPKLAASPPVPVHPDLEVRPLRAPAPAREIGMIWRVGSAKTAAARAVAGIVSDAVGPALGRAR